jgi:hypothetical protein
MKSRVYDSGKPEGRHQLIQAINEATNGIKKKWDACSGSIQWHNRWQHAFSVTEDISHI